jgi:hypothetical protein
LSTQRPSELSTTVLAQCGTWAVFRLASEQDLRAVSSAGEWVDRQEISRIAGLPRQQALVFGSSVAMPTRVIAPRAEPTPRSADPDFSLWCKSAAVDEPPDSEVPEHEEPGYNDSSDYDRWRDDQADRAMDAIDNINNTCEPEDDPF